MGPSQEPGRPAAPVPPLPPLPLDLSAFRRLEIAHALLGLWTGRGLGQAALAPLWLDGTLDLLEEFVSGDALRDGGGGNGGGADTAAAEPAPIPRLGAQPTFEEFNARFMQPNLPVVFPASPWPWPSAPGWVSADGSPDLSALAASFPPGTAAPVVSAAGPRRAMTLEAYADWRRAMPPDLPAAERLYLKDFMAVAAGGAFHVPAPLADDWLNVAFDAGRRRGSAAAARGFGERVPGCSIADHRFVYTGPAGTTTPLHCDVMGTFSWSANLCGRKRWAFFPPEQTHLLFDRFGRGLAPTVAPEARNALLYPRLARTAPLWLEQGPGEVVFVPSGWHHEVRNADDALSVNCNWFNAANVAWVWSHVKRAARAAEGSALPSARSGCAAALDDTEEGEPSALGPGGAAAEREDPEAAGAAEEGAGEPGGRGDAGSGPSEEGGGGAAKPKKEMDGASFFEVLRITALRVLAEVEGDSGGDIPLGGLVPLPGGLGHKRLTLERIAAVLAEMEGEPAFAPLVASLAGEDGSGGVEGLRRRIEVCLAASVWGGDEARQARAG